MENSGQKGPHHLEFKGYSHDPLATLIVDRLKWQWRFTIAYVAAYLASAGLGCVMYLVRDGKINIELSGGYGAILAGLLVTLVVGGFGSFLYLRISCKAGTIYRKLADEGIIVSTDPEIQNLVNGDSNSVRKAQDKLLWPLLAIGFTVLVGIIIVYNCGLDPNRGEETIYRSTVTFITQPVWSLGIYIIAMTVIRTLLTIQGLYKIFHIGKVSVYPLHPDRCGGLTPLRDYALDLSYFVAIFGFAIALYAFITSQVYELGSVSTNWSRTASFPLMWIFGSLYLILAPLTFFGTLATAHGPMQKVKIAQMQALSKRFSEEYKFLHKELTGDAKGIKGRVDNLKRLYELHRITEAFPVWPWDWGSIRRFTAAVSSPLILMAIQVSITVIRI